MGYMHIEGEPRPLVRLSPVSTRPPQPDCPNAMREACAQIEATARKMRRKLVRNAFERYRARPWLLDTIAPGLSTAHPAFIFATVEKKTGIPWGRIDMLGVLPINLAGAALYARWLRLEMRRETINEVVHE